MVQYDNLGQVKLAHAEDEIRYKIFTLDFILVSLFCFISDEKLDRIKGSREVSEVAGFFVFSHIRIMGCFRLGKG